MEASSAVGRPERMKFWRRVRHSAGYRAVCAAAWLAAALPRWLAQPVFWGLALLCWMSFRRDRRAIERHAGQASLGLSRRGLGRFSRRVFVESGGNVADALRYIRRPAKDLLSLVDAEGEEHLLGALSEGRGVVAVTGHIGAWELLGGYFVLRGIPITVIARPLKDERFEMMLRALRKNLGVQVVHEGGDLRPAFQALKRNEVLGILIDQGRRWPGAWVPFFSRPAHMTTAAAEFARRTGAALVPMSIQRVGMRHRVTVLPPIRVDGERSGAVVTATATAARSLESLIWRRPAQWSWGYDIWSVPGGRGRVGARDESGVEREASVDEASEEPSPAMKGMESRVIGRRAHRSRRVALAVAMFLVSITSTLAAISGCNPGEDRTGSPPERAPTVGEPVPSQELSEFVLRETDESGRVAWIFRAEEARIFEARDEVEAEKIHIDFFDPEGKVASVLVADQAVIERRSNDMHASGNVIVRNSDGDQLFTEELRYSGDREKIYTDEFVRVLRGRDELTGYGLETDPDLRGGQLEIQRDFRATVRDETVPALGPGLGAGAGAGDSSGSSIAGEPERREDQDDAGTP